MISLFRAGVVGMGPFTETLDVLEDLGDAGVL
jgi:hypothetical protein